MAYKGEKVCLGNFHHSNDNIWPGSLHFNIKSLEKKGKVNISISHEDPFKSWINSFQFQNSLAYNVKT